MNIVTAGGLVGLLAAARFRYAQMDVGKSGCLSAAGRALQEAKLEQIGFIDVLYRVSFLADSRG
jgi:hypothetical protein